MYRVRPYFEIKKVRLPNCMYQMKPLHNLTGMKTGGDEVDFGNWGYLIVSWILCFGPL